MRVFVAGKLVQRSWQDNDGKKRQSVEIQVTHVGPDLKFATSDVAKSTAEGSRSSSDGPSAASSAEDKQTAWRTSLSPGYGRSFPPLSRESRMAGIRAVVARGSAGSP